jgi:hypothetical protein
LARDLGDGVTGFVQELPRAIEIARLGGEQPERQLRDGPPRPARVGVACRREQALGVVEATLLPGNACERDAGRRDERVAVRETACRFEQLGAHRAREVEVAEDGVADRGGVERPTEPQVVAARARDRRALVVERQRLGFAAGDADDVAEPAQQLGARRRRNAVEGERGAQPLVGFRVIPAHVPVAVEERRELRGLDGLVFEPPHQRGPKVAELAIEDADPRQLRVGVTRIAVAR